MAAGLVGWGSVTAAREEEHSHAIRDEAKFRCMLTSHLVKSDLLLLASDVPTSLNFFFRVSRDLFPSKIYLCLKEFVLAFIVFRNTERRLYSI